MAEAGSVAPVFRDEGYVATEKYDFYHALIHNNKLYFCRQDGTIGHEPQEESDEYWFLSLDGNFADAASLGGETAEQWQAKITNILNGTTPVGDSKKLNGKEESALSVANADTVDRYHASEFAKSKDFYRGDTFVGMETGNTNELYRLQLQNGTVAVYKSTDSGATWSLLGILSSNLDLANYLPITGGTLNADLIITKDGVGKAVFTGANNVAYMSAKSDTLSRALSLSADASFGECLKIGNTVVHHDGNSAKVLKATSAPSDTTAIWVDTTNKKIKAYISGAWTALA